VLIFVFGWIKESDAKFVIAVLVSETIWRNITKKMDNFQAYSQSKTNFLPAHLSSQQATVISVNIIYSILIAL